MGATQDDARSSKFVLLAGTLVLHPVSIQGIQSQRTHVDRPDRTRRTTDQKVPGECTMAWKLRDAVELAAVRSWRNLREHLDCTLTYLTEDDEPVSVFQIEKACPRDFENGDLSVEDDATEVVQTWTFTYDDVAQIV